MTTSLDERLRHLLPNGPQQDQATTDLADWLHNAAQDVAEEALQALLDASSTEWNTSPQIASALLVGTIRRHQTSTVELRGDQLTSIQHIYPELTGYPVIQSLILRLCISSGTYESVGVAIGLLVEHRPIESRLLVEVFSDLLRLKSDAVDAVFPMLLRGLDQPNLAGFVLDYANYAFRNKLVTPHPATPHVGELTSLLSQLADRLGHLQDAGPASDEDAVQLGKQVTESVALGIPLCDALAGIGDPTAVASLNKVLQIEHRRLRIEAAAALARLGVDDAKQVLVAMAAEPIERVRVLAYAEELGIQDQVDDEFSNIVALAEAEFVMYLAQPTQMGIAPQHIELVDQRELAWPGFEEPRNCFLFQFVYEFPSGPFTNIGIAGPVVMTFESDLTVLPYDDVYAIFAGWHVQHPDIFAIEADRIAEKDEIHIERMMGCLTELSEFQDVRPLLMGMLLGRRFLVATAHKDDKPGWAMVCDDSISWMGLGAPQNPLTAQDVFHLFVGRALTRAFN